RCRTADTKTAPRRSPPCFAGARTCARRTGGLAAAGLGSGRRGERHGSSWPAERPAPARPRSRYTSSPAPPPPPPPPAPPGLPAATPPPPPAGRGPPPPAGQTDPPRGPPAPPPPPPPPPPGRESPHRGPPPRTPPARRHTLCPVLSGATASPPHRGRRA